MVGVIYITVTAYDGTDFQNLYLPNTLMANNSTSIVGNLLLSANRVPRLFQEAFYFAVGAVLSTRVIGAVGTQPLPSLQGNYHTICQIR